MKPLLLTLLLLPILALAQPSTTNYPTLKYDPTSGAFVPATTNGHTIGPASGIIVGTPTAGDVSVFNSASTIRTGTTSEVMKFTDDGTTFLAGWDGGAGVFKRFTLDSLFQVSAVGSDKLISLNIAALSSALSLDDKQDHSDDLDSFVTYATWNGTRLQLSSGTGEGVLELVNSAANTSALEIYQQDVSNADAVIYSEDPTGEVFSVYPGGIFVREKVWFGTQGDTGPMFKRNTTSLQLRLGDDSAYTNLAVLDTAYDATTWNGNNNVPTMNAVRDKFESFTTGLTIGTTTITSGTNTRLLYDNSGVLGEYTTVPVANGGTNIASYAVGDLLYASGSTTLSKLADVATGSVLISGGVTTAPAWSTAPTILGTNITSLNGSNISSGTVASARLGNVPLGSIGFTTDGAGATITTGVKGYFIAPATCTITGWSISADGASPTCTIDVWKVATGTTLPTVSNTIMGTKPALATGNAIRSTTMTAWTTATITAGDIIGFNVDAVTVATKLTFQLETTK